jgi:hypothetical protein
MVLYTLTSCFFDFINDVVFAVLLYEKSDLISLSRNVTFMAPSLTSTLKPRHRDLLNLKVYTLQ